MAWHALACRLKRPLTLIVGLAIAVGSGMPGSARAQDYGFADDWTYRCMEDWDSKEEVCTTEMQTLQDDRLFLIYFAHAKGGAAPLVVTGDEQPFQQAGVKVDDSEAVVTERCEPGYCYFDAEESRKLLAQFRKGRRARIWVALPDTKRVLDQEVSLTGFSKALGGP